MTSDDPQEIRDLLTRIADRDSAALSQLHRLMADRLFGLTLSILKDRPESEDALQDTFMKIWKNAIRYEDKLGSPVAWLLTIARNTAYDRYRKRSRQAEQLDTLQETMRDKNPAEAKAADDHLLDHERKNQIRAALANLGTEQKKAIEMAFFSGHTQSEVAQKLGVPLGTVKARIRRGMQNLKPFLSPIS